ncbi:hypothetical protein CSB45_08725 [candidate division KSB3 bacterium]|uniref:SIMPL domain-containing protein n=1 Tax=candidate division KSB3 bacterium TaxID=2044937 RepID=A0A2G6E5D6_9BACT|nr:MAG: hypothetical protein CSB45_08725 [candidate division KSB3 bacterium]PIE29695.1 MAG: hypothetical protein CSA57_07710 [candidate division KSB3 bacterium]
MKEIRKIISFVLIIFFSPYLVLAEEQRTPRLITVTGEADVRVVPNEVILLLGIETWDIQLKAAKSENDQRIQKIFDLAKKYKIEEKYIQTDYITLEPRYEDQYEHRKFIGFFVKQSIAITIKDLSKFEHLLSDSLEAGVNYVHGVHFQTTELRKFRDQARSLAIKAAQEKAQHLAKGLGQKIGKPYNIQESTSDWWSLYSSHWAGSNFTAQNVIQNMSGTTASSENIALGQIKVNAKVLVSFELEQ